MERLAHRIAVEMLAMGEDVEVLTPGRIDAKRERASATEIRDRLARWDGVCVRAIGRLRTLWRVRGMRRLAGLLYTIELVLFVLRHASNAKGFIIFGIQSEFAWLNLLARFRRDIRGFGIEVGGGSSLNFLTGSRLVSGRLSRHMIRRGRLPIVVFGKRIRSQYVEMGFAQERLEVIPNGIATPKDVFPYSPERTNIVFVGRLEQFKGARYLLEAYARLDRCNCRLVLHGSGPEEAELRALVRQLGIGQDVEFSNPSPAPIEQVLSKARIMVIPSVGEGMSTVQLEAMACGIPIIATDVGCNGEVLGFCEPVPEGEFLQNEHGLLVAARDSGALARAITHIISDSATLGEMSRANARRFSQQYMTRNVTESYLSLLQSLKG